MKHKLLLIVWIASAFSLSAREGMWLPFLLEKMNEKEMKSMGMKISAKDIYDINQGSLKDAIVIFGGGCTGELISNQGLVLTNHHCGYGTVQGLSSVQNNYLLNGFWAKNKSEELPCPGLTVTFIVRIDDVTQRVQAGSAPGMHDTTRSKLIQSNIAAIEKETEKNTGYLAQVKSFFYDNQYYLFLMEKYTDVRLVGFPPNGIGKFGGDTDNWAWPRHTGDFGLFRIYAGKNNKPAPYAKDNIPYNPKRFLKINIGGIQENDFTMVYGFPGRTTEYLTSDGVAEIMNVLDPARIRLRETRLNIMEADMKKSEATFIQYASKQSGIANYYKKWKGELMGLQVNNAIEKKKDGEARFMQWVNADGERRPKYGFLLDSIAACYRQHQHAIKLNEYIMESVWASEVLKKAGIFSSVLAALDTIASMDSLGRYANEMTAFARSINYATDRAITEGLFAIYAADISESDWVSAKNIDKIYTQSFLISDMRFSQLLAVRDKADIRSLIKMDPAYKTFKHFDSLQKSNGAMLRKSLLKLNKLYGQYILALQEYHKGKQFYPDANSTLRVTYGKVEGVTPQDGMNYTYLTTLDGAIRKHNPLKEEFSLPPKLIQLHKNKDYGRYAIWQQGNLTVPLAFLSSNHTTGGNSGSPVLNGKGELIGTNFDRIWEGTMSDILFDPNLCRNITLDIRYTLFIIEKFGGAKWIIDELELVN